MKVQVERRAGWIDLLRAYKIVVDGRVVGKVGNRGSTEFDVAPGRHTIQMKIDWCGSPTLEFHAAEGRRMKFMARSLSGFRVLLAFLFAIFWWNGYITLEQMEDEVDGRGWAEPPR